jgi:phage shock protein PspC (stress-responsive transcriptional regulator)
MTSPDASPRRLRRSANDQRIAGVAGGIADHFGLDPTLVRIAFGILALFGGVGLAAYAVGVFVMPAEEGAPPLSARAKWAIAMIAVAAVLSVPFAGASAVALIVPIAIGVLVWRLFGGRADPRLVRASMVVVTIAGAVVLGIAAGVAVAFGGGAIVAGVVIAAGLALIASGLRGGARWLIVPALLLAIPASIVSAADLRLEGGVGDRSYRPSLVSELRPAYRLGAGRLHLDLRDVSFERAQQIELAARVGVGELEVTVPEGVCVQTTADAGVGAIELFGRLNEGVDVDADRGGAAAAGQPVLRLRLHAGVGDVQVDRRPGRIHAHRARVSDGCEA